MKKILLADDNEPDRVLYRRFLGRQMGFQRLEFHEATSGQQAVEQFARLRPDCVLLDYHLQDMTGLEVLEQFRQLVPTDNLCVVMITGSGNEKLAVRALQSGALDYLMKGQFDQELLTKTVTYAIEKNEWRQYQARYHAEVQSVNQALRTSLAELTETRQQLQARNQQLARTNADLDNFVYAASHDLRQPVHNLAGLFEELRRSATFADPDEAQLLALIDSSLQALTTTIDDLAIVVQEQRRAEPAAAEQVLFQEIVDDVCQALRPQILESRAHISTEFGALRTLCYSRVNLRTVLLNLVSNALKYRHPGRAPHIIIRTSQPQGQALLQVQDNGRGFDLARHGPELFQLFRRFHPDVQNGTGVGLFLVNRLVQTAGGHIEVESQPEEGSTFNVFLTEK